MIYGLMCAVVLLSVSVAILLYDSYRRDRVFERLLSDKYSLPTGKKPKTGVISPYKKPMNGGGDSD